MSLIRQVWLLLALTMLLAFAGAFGVTVISAQHYLETQVSMENGDRARTIAVALSQSRGDPRSLLAILAAEVGNGHYARVRLTDEGGKILFDHAAVQDSADTPAWFIGMLGIHPQAGRAPVSDGDGPIGQLEVQGSTRYTQHALWEGSVRSLLLLGGLAVCSGLLASVGVRRIRRPLEATVRQAQALTERRFVTVSEPAVSELRNVTRAMNAMVERLKAMFEEQSGQVEMLRRQANCDLLTGVSNRGHFMSRLKVMLGGEDGSSGGALILVRLSDLQGVNRRLGRVRTDALLKSTGGVIVESARRFQQFEAGRLNGADFALILPEAASLREPAIDVAARLRSVLREQDPEVTAVVGAVRWWHSAPLSSLLAAADQALARAEARGPYAVELDDAGDGVALGENAWRARIEAALDAGRVGLVEFPLIDPAHKVVHHECPLRMQLSESGPMVAAAEWLPMARRAQLNSRIDLMAVGLALRAIEADDMPRAVNISPGSLLDSGFVPRLREALAGHGESAPGLWLELAEDGAWRHLGLVRELVAQAHACGARVGLEHAGEQLSDSAALLEAGLDFIKLDASFTEGLAEDKARSQHVASTVRMLHGLGLKVYAEGVASLDDKLALWACQIDGLTGPAALL